MEALGVLLVVPLEVLLGVPQVALQMVPVVVVEAVVQGFLVVVVVLVVGKDSSNPVVGSILPTLVCNLAGLLVALELLALLQQLQRPAVDSTDNMLPMQQNNQADPDLGQVADLVAVLVVEEVAVHQIAVVVVHIVVVVAVAADVVDRTAGAVVVAVHTGHIVVANCLVVVVAAAVAVVAVGSSLVDSSFVHLPGCNHFCLLFPLLFFL